MVERVKSRLNNTLFVRPGTIRAGRVIYEIKNFPKELTAYPGFVDGRLGEPFGRVKRIIDNGKTLIFKIKLDKKQPKAKKTDDIIERLNRLLKHTDFGQKRIKEIIFKSLFYNFTIKELEKILKEKEIQFVKPPENTDVGYYGNTICLKIRDRYYVM